MSGGMLEICQAVVYGSLIKKVHIGVFRKGLWSPYWEWSCCWNYG
jgi:hypothetical protein